MRRFLSESWTEINPQFPLPSLPRSSSASSVYLPPHLASCFIFINCISLNLVFYSPSVFFKNYYYYSFLESLCLVHLERSPPPPPLPVWEGVSVSEAGTHRNAASGQKGNITTLLSTRLSLHPPPPLHRDPCCLDRCEWRSSCGWLRAKHIASLPQQFKYWSTALFPLLKLCIQLCRQTSLTVNCSKPILQSLCMHLFAYIYLEHAFICVCLWGLYVDWETCGCRGWL